MLLLPIALHALSASAIIGLSNLQLPGKEKKPEQESAVRHHALRLREAARGMGYLARKLRFARNKEERDCLANEINQLAALMMRETDTIVPPTPADVVAFPCKSASNR